MFFIWNWNEEWRKIEKQIKKKINEIFTRKEKSGNWIEMLGGGGRDKKKLNK